MADIANYDQSGYDYTKYWIDRQYEDKAEKRTLRTLLPKKIYHMLDLGGSYGRLSSAYINRCQKATIFDYSEIALNQAQKMLSEKGIQNVSTKQGNAYETGFADNTFDVVIAIRLLHHIEDPQQLFSEIHRIIKDKGTLILDVPNKIHLLAWLKALKNKDLGFRENQEPIRHRTTQSDEDGIFINYHPEAIMDILEKAGFRILSTRSVTNLRGPRLKKYLNTSTLLLLDRMIEPIFRLFNFGPSVWIQCQKT